MSQITHNTSFPNDGMGDALRDAFNNQNSMNTELYNGKVDKVIGKGLSTNDYSDAEKTKLTGIAAGAEVNVQSDWDQSDNTADDYIKNKPDQLFSSVGFFDYADLATQSVPLTFVAGVDKKLTNDTLGATTNTDNNPYGVSSIWDSTTHAWNFSQLSVGDTLDIRFDVTITTTSANQRVKGFITLGLGSASEFDTMFLDTIIKTAGTYQIVRYFGIYIGSEDIRDNLGEMFINTDDSGTGVVNGWYARIIRKAVNIIDLVNPEDLAADHFRGNYNANTNIPVLANGFGQIGDWVVVATAGTQDYGSGNITSGVGDVLSYNGASWFKKVNNNQALISTVTSLSSSVLSSQDATGLKNYINALGSPFAVASTEELFFVITESNQVFKLNLRGRSFGGSEPDITETDLIELNNSLFNIKFRGDRYEHQATGGALSSFGFGAPTTVGSASNVAANFASTYSDAPRTSWNHRISNTTAVAGTIAEFYQTTYQVSNELGFYFSGKVAFNTSANARGIVGLSNSVLALTNVNPSSLTNIIAFGFDDTDDNLQIMHNDSSGLATKVDTSIDLDKGNALPSANLRERDFVIEIFNFKGSANVFFKVLSLRTGKKFFHVATTNLPSVTTGLTFRFFTCNNTDASVASVIFSNILIQRES